MSSPKPIYDSKRRRSIAKLTRSPLSSSPLVSPGRIINNSVNSHNGVFLKQDLAGREEESVSLNSKRSSTPEDRSSDDYSTGIKNPKVVMQINKHLPNQDSIQNEGGDITRDLYKISNNTSHLRRSRSLASMDMEHHRKGSTASSLIVPGGFRRDFIQNKNQIIKPNILTKNFIEFLSIYGHFAGEELEDEDVIACHYTQLYNEEELPLTKKTIGTASNKKAYFLLLKAFVGTGVLFLPKAFSNGGLLFSIFVLLLFGVLSLWCYLTLAFAKMATNVSGFSEMGLKLYGKWLQKLILFSIVISQLGFVAAYIVFTSENLKAFLENTLGIDYEVIWLTIAQVIVLFPLSLVRDITKLSLSALMANVFILVGLATVVFYVSADLWNSGQFGPHINFAFNGNDFSLFIGTAIFAFEGIGLIIPIQESMIKPNEFPKVLFQVIVTISFIFILIGTLGYVTYGDNIKTVIILNLPSSSILVNSVQLLYSIAILLSSPIQLFPAIRLVESKLFIRTGKYSLRVKWMKNLFRLSFVLLTAFVAIHGGQNLDKFVSFIGCFACIPLVYMYPPLLHLKSCCMSDPNLTPLENKKRYLLGLFDYVLIFIGSIAMIYTTYNIIK